MRTPLGVSLLSLLVGAVIDRVDGQCLSFDDLLAIGVSCCPDTACVELPSSCSAQCAGTIMPMYTNCLPGEEVLPVVDEVLADHLTRLHSECAQPGPVLSPQNCGFYNGNHQNQRRDQARESRPPTIRGIQGRC